MHDPHAYYSPDVVLDMGTIDFDDQGNDAVRITGASGAQRPDTLKVVAGYHDGWMGTGQIGFSWPDAYLKCETSANIIKGLVGGARLEARTRSTSSIPATTRCSAPNADPAQRDNLNECFLRMTIRTKDRRIAEGFSRLFPWLGLSGPPYAGGFRGVERSRELLGIWPTLVRRDADRAARQRRRRGGRMKVGLWKIAHARSGDKADRSDIGLFAYDAPTYEVLKREVTRERIARAFRRHLQGPGRDLSARQSARAEDRAQRRAAGRRRALAAHRQSRQERRGRAAAHGDRGAGDAAPARAPMSVAQRKPRARRNNESNRREELLRVSARLFREKGFDGTSIRDISSAAGMHSGSPFYHFKTKQDILLAVMEQGLAEGLRRLEDAIAQPGTAEQRCVRMIRAQIGTILEDGNDFIPVLLYDWRSLTEANRRRIIALNDRYDALWQR